MISPTVGRVVWFYPSRSSAQEEPLQPFAGTVAFVHSDRCVNLSVVDHEGKQQSCTGVKLLQDDDKAPEGGYYARWMPYQVGQAKAAEGAQTKAQLDKK